MPGCPASRPRPTSRAGRSTSGADAGTVVTESGAIAQVLGERHAGARLLPAPGAPGRVRWIETHAWVLNSHLPAMRDWMYAAIDGAPEGALAAKGGK